MTQTQIQAYERIQELLGKDEGRHSIFDGIECRLSDPIDQLEALESAIESGDCD